MRRVTLPVSFYLPEVVYGPAQRWHQRRRRRAMTSGPRNILGDRDIEWSWVSANIPDGTGAALDFGNGGGPLGLIAAMRGYRVTALDLNEVEWPYSHPNLTFLRGDVLEADLTDAGFDLVINCSTVEHVGLAGRYNITDGKAEGDLQAMQRLRRLLKPGGLMLLTVPVGRDAVFAPMCRVYGPERLPRLTAGFRVEDETFWTKDDRNRWRLTTRADALAVQASAASSRTDRDFYALGCMRLRNVFP